MRIALAGELPTRSSTLQVALAQPEPHSAAEFAERLAIELGWNAVAPSYLEKVRVD